MRMFGGDDVLLDCQRKKNLGDDSPGDFLELELMKNTNTSVIHILVPNMIRSTLQEDLVKHIVLKILIKLSWPGDLKQKRTIQIEKKNICYNKYILIISKLKFETRTLQPESLHPKTHHLPLHYIRFIHIKKKKRKGNTRRVK